MPTDGMQPLRVLADDGGGGLPFVVPTGLIVAGAVTVLILLAVLALIGWRIWRRARRSGLVERGMLQFRAAALTAGPQREIAELRLRLRTDLDQTRRVLAAVTADSANPQILTGLLPGLQQTANSLDAHLHLMEREPDRNYLAATLSTLRDRTETVRRDALALRQTALSLQSDTDELHRDLTEQDLRDRIIGLQAGIAEIRALHPPHNPGPGPEPTRRPR